MIQYSPSSSVNLDSSLIMIDAGDPAVTYGPGWQDMRDSKNARYWEDDTATRRECDSRLQW
jgi:hypothetical protein